MTRTKRRRAAAETAEIGARNGPLPADLRDLRGPNGEGTRHDMIRRGTAGAARLGPRRAQPLLASSTLGKTLKTLSSPIMAMICLILGGRFARRTSTRSESPTRSPRAVELT